MIPVVTQPCFDDDFIPIGVVTAESELFDGFTNCLPSLVEKLQAAAPEGTERLYNLKWKMERAYGHDFLRGTADAFK